ncbi:MAG: hypothetical protein K0R18_188 [Bacillales bacterium]|jgi:hypothetical protein|nr:hypothetical protein [Bacillales bacterium]
MEFNCVETLKQLVQDIEGKMPTSIIDLLDEKVEYLIDNGITENMHIGKTDWDLISASEWLLSMFIGIVKKGKEKDVYFNAFGSWLTHVYHFVIDNKADLK